MLDVKMKMKIHILGQFPANKYMLKYNNKSTTKKCGICLNLAIGAS